MSKDKYTDEPILLTGSQVLETIAQLYKFQKLAEIYEQALKEIEKIVDEVLEAKHEDL